MFLYVMVLGMFVAGNDEPYVEYADKELMTLAQCQQMAPAAAFIAQGDAERRWPGQQIVIKWKCVAAARQT
jgi:hypothetical protein